MEKIYQGSVAEFTVVRKPNQSRKSGTGNGGNHFPAAFCVTFFRKKVTKKPAPGIVVEKKASFISNKPAVHTLLINSELNNMYSRYEEIVAEDYKYTRADADPEHSGLA
ncbi:MAG: hypothetical protein KF746_09415 [Chitinophagaceae bacterium]|nr:hypothetical protein [Chitinophagaceae bacterium]